MTFTEYCELNGLPNPKFFIPAAIIATLIVVCIFGSLVQAETLTASWYSVESCRREGTSGIMSNGKELKNEDMVCASWDYPFQTILRITNITNGRSVEVVVSDRGPAKRLYKKGRVIDLSKGAFAKIANLKQGVIPIKIVRVK